MNLGTTIGNAYISSSEEAQRIGQELLELASGMIEQRMEQLDLRYPQENNTRPRTVRITIDLEE